MSAWFRGDRNKLCFGIACAVIAAIHLFAISDLHVADDVYFAAALSDRTLGEFLAFRYAHWSGRIPIEMALVLIVQHPWLWKLTNAMMVLLLCYSSSRAASAGGTRYSTLLALGLLMLLSPAVLYESAWWITGSINYLWPAALGMYGLLAFLETDRHSPIERLGFLLAAGFAMYNEQLALVLLPITVGLAIARRSKRGWNAWDIIHPAFMAANAWIVFSAPGSQSRYLAEQGLRFPNYADLDVLDKAAIGLELVVKGTIDPANLLVALLVFLAAVLTVRGPLGKLGKMIVLLPLSFLALDYLFAPPFFEEAALRHLFQLPPVGGGSASSSRLYVLYAWTTFTIACLATASASAFWHSRREVLLVAVTLIMGMASLAALGFSPTAYASGWRIHFVCQLAYLLIAMPLISRIREEFGVRAYWCVLGMIGALASYRVARLCLH
ncbi:MAG: DUF6056 family protein [Pseudoxanthomonas sp.]